MIEFPFIKRAKKKYFFALDIGTQAVKTLIFRKEKEKIFISGISTVPFESSVLFNSWNFQIDFIKQAILKAIKEAQVQANLKEKIEFVFLGLPPNIIKSSISFQDFRRKDIAGKIQRNEEKKILDEVLANSQREISQKIWKEFGILDKDIHFLDTKILEAKINGYEVPQLSGFPGQNIRFKVLNYFLPKNYLENIKKIFRDLNLKILRIIQPAYNLPIALKDSKERGFFLDIGAKITQIIFLKEGKICLISEIPVGGEIFSQKLSETLGISWNEAEDLKIRYSKRLLTEETRRRIKEIFLPGIQFWFSSLKLEIKKLLSLEVGGLTGNFISLFGGASLQPEFEEILRKGDWEDLPIFGEAKIKILFPQDFRRFEDKTKRLNSPQNIPSLLICYYD